MASNRLGSFRPDIQGMRAIAVAMVVGVHAGVPMIPGGFVGVDVFFVISGFLITAHLARSLEQDGRVGFLKFYAARAQRLLPALTLTMLVTLFLAAIFLSPGEQKTVAATAAHQSLYASNIYFLRQATDYFAADATLNPLLHTWSLAVEEQFYLIWPCLLLILWRLWARKGLIIGIPVIAVASFALCLWLTDWREPWAFYGAPTRAWEFGLGAMLNFLPVRFCPPKTQPYVAAAGLVAVLGSMVFLSSSQPFPGAIAAVAAVGAAAMISGGALGGGFVYKILSVRPMQVIGALSYSWYLWHWPILAFTVILWPNASLAVRLTAAGTALVVAAIAYWIVERPARRWSQLKRKPAWALCGAALLTLVSVVQLLAFALTP